LIQRFFSHFIETKMGLFDRIGSAVSGVASKVGAGIKGAYNGTKSVVGGIASKVASAGKTIGHHAWDGIKTAGHVMAEHAPTLAGAAMGALGNAISPGLGAVVGKAVGNRIGERIKSWHADKYGAHASGNSETGTGRMVRKIGKRVTKVSKGFGHLADAVGLGVVNPPKQKVKKPRTDPWAGGVYRRL
jgi:hypothetical protein